MTRDEYRYRTEEERAAGHINRTFGGLEVVDARKDLRVTILPCDLEKATRKDPAYCVFAQACRRVFNIEKVLFFRSRAYVELPDKKGVHRVERFIVPREMGDLVRQFDQGHRVIPEAGFELKAPMPSERLDAIAKARPAKFQREKERRKIIGQKSGGIPEKARSRYKAIVVDTSVRNGTGAVHFIRTKTGEPA